MRRCLAWGDTQSHPGTRCGVLVSSCLAVEPRLFTHCKIDCYQGIVIMMEQRHLIFIFEIKHRGSISTEVLIYFWNSIPVLWHVLTFTASLTGKEILKL